MTDRRTRLRPKNGARSLYYGGTGTVPGAGNTGNDDSARSALLNQNNKPFADLSPNSPNSLVGSIGNLTNGVIDSAIGAVGSVADNVNGVFETLGGLFNSTQDAPNPNIINEEPKKSSTNYNTNLLAPLAQTDGMIWPYTPNITISRTVEYNTYSPSHVNQGFRAYTRTPSDQLAVTGQMFVQNETEASYALAQMHFLRTVTKMSFGASSQNAGTPPPILLFSAYGEFMYNDLPVVVDTFTLDFSEDVDYIPVPNTNTFVPSSFVLNVVLTPQITPSKLKTFNMEQFRSGSLLKKGGWF